MGKKQRDCIYCGAPVGFLDRAHCCRCERQRREEETKASCPACGKRRVLQEATGRCVLCSKTCISCGGPLRFRTSTTCRPCRVAEQYQQRLASREPCRRCGRLGYLREDSGWCGICVKPRPVKDPPRVCDGCGQLRRHAGLGLCSACWQRHPDRPFIAGANLANRLDKPPTWLADFVADLAAKHCVGRSCTMIGAVGRLLADEHPNHPQAVLERARQPGRSMGSLARALEQFFTQRAMALPTDQAQQLAAGRRQRRVEAVPAPLRPAVVDFCASLLQARERARRAGTRPRSDGTIESALAAVRDFARYLQAQRGKQDWAVVDVHDVEAFLSAHPQMRTRHLAVLRQFFKFARAHRILLVDPTRGVPANRDRAFKASTLSLSEQRALFRRWTNEADVHPHEALFGLFALLHGAASRELRGLRVDAIDADSRSVRLGQRPHPVPLDPASWTVLQRCLTHRQQLRTDNPHVVITRGTKALSTPASMAYCSHLLDAAAVAPHRLRVTRLADLVNTMDPKLVAAAFGMNPEGVLIYLADHVDQTRLPATRASSGAT
jgi:site-specific recombinase XerD